MDAQAPQTTVHTNGTVHALLFLAFIVFVAVLEGLTFALYVLFAIPMLVHDVCTLVWGRLPFVDAIYHGITQQSGNWVKHDGSAYAARVAETIAFPYTPLLIELGLWLVAFHFVFFPFLQRCSQLILERRAKFWPQLNKKMSPYGITVAADAVWGGAIGLWHVPAAVGLLVAWLSGSTFVFRRAVVLEVVWEVHDSLLLLTRTSFYRNASPKIVRIMATHHVLGLLYIPFGYLKFSNSPHVKMLALSLISHSTVGNLCKAGQHLIDGAERPLALGALHSFNFACGVVCRLVLFPPACLGAGRTYNISDAAIGPVVELVLDSCFVLMLGFSCFILKVSGGRAYQWVAKGLQERRDDANADEEVGQILGPQWDGAAYNEAARLSGLRGRAGARGGGRSPAARGTPGRGGRGGRAKRSPARKSD